MDAADLADLGDRIHELKNQLGVILGFAELLIDDCRADDRRSGDLEEIKHAAERAMAVVSQLGCRFDAIGEPDA